VDILLVEARYQRAVFSGDEDVVVRDFQLRYGDRWRELWEASSGAAEEDVKAAEDHAAELVELVLSRIDDLDTASLYAKYGRNFSVEQELRLGMELLGRPQAVEALLRWGLVMHFSNEVVSTPPYLTKLILELMQRGGAQVADLWSELEAHSRDPALMALFEGLLTGELDEDLHRTFYGPAPSELRIGRAAVYKADVGLVINPAYSPEEVLDVLLQLKKRRADALARALSLHGEYEFSSEYRCGTHYISLDGSAEKSGLVVLCPWLSYSRRLWKKARNIVLVVEGQRPPEMRPLRHGVIFVKGGEAEVVKPQTPSKLFDYIIDVLYSAGFYVLEDEESAVF
jgi:hypothetical protein